MLIRNAAWSFGGQIARLATAIILIAVLDPAARGLQSLLVLLPTLVASLTLFGVGSATPVLLHRGVDEQRLCANLLGLALLVIGVVALLLIPCLPLAAQFLTDPARYHVSSPEVVLGFLLLPPTLLGDYLRSLLAARRDLRQVALSQSAHALVQLGLTLLLVPGLGLGALGAVLAAIAGASAGLAWTLAAVRRFARIRVALDWSVLRPLLGLGLRGHIGNVAQTFNYRLDALLVQGYLGQAAVGLYQTGVTLAELIWYIPNAVGAALLPHVAANGRAGLTPRVVRHTLFLTVVGALGLVAVVWPALALLRPAYLGAIRPMGILLIGVVALSIHKVLASDLSGHGMPHYPTYTSLLALLITLVGDLMLIPRWGIVGAAWASTAAYCVQTAALLIIFGRVTRQHWWALFVPAAGDLDVYRRLARVTRHLASR